MPHPTTTVVGYGLGLDSTGALLRIMDDPEQHGILPDFSNLVVITSQVGDEWSDTYDLVERHILPMFAERSIRYIQVARAHPASGRVYDLLSDTRTPTHLVRRGNWSLAQEHRAAGTIPLRGGPGHPCSVKFKGQVLDASIRDLVGTGYRHLVGYEYGEPSRAEKDSTYTTNGRIPWYPLIEAGLTRDMIQDYVLERIGIIWPKSACVACPFTNVSGGLQLLLERARRFPNDIGAAGALEYAARAINSNMTLYAKTNLDRLMRESGQVAAG